MQIENVRMHLTDGLLADNQFGYFWNVLERQANLIK